MTWPVLPDFLVVAQSTRGTVLAFDRRSGWVTELDRTGSFVLSQRDQFDGLEDAATCLANLFERDRGEVLTDLEGLAGMLQTSADHGEPGSSHDLHAHALAQLGDRVAGPAPDATISYERCVAALSFPLTIRVFDEQLANVVESLFAVLPSASSSEVLLDVWFDGGAVVVTRNHREIIRTLEISAALSTLVSWVTLEAVRSGATDTSLVHAAGVVLDGQGVVLAGASNQGKSSTALALVRDGAEYLSDEVISVGLSDNRVTGLARPFGLEGPILDTHSDLRPSWWDSAWPDRRWTIPAQSVGHVARDAHLDLLVFLEYRPDSAPEVEVLQAGDALSRLGPLLFNAADVSAEGLGLLDTVVSTTTAIHLRHPGSLVAADLIRRRVWT
jgi:hypothetical protein